MLKKIVLASMLAASAFAVMPTAAAANPNDECMLRSGCFWASGGDTSPGHWVCSDPAIYMMCVSPDGLTADVDLSLKAIKE
ncbi:hypothetical protein [Brevundimonas sp.]|uniref:hypothetical protein n=1 Tax=Brevundimonas sp. TaxID=1871086 RepID=UPI002D709E04|nr:hypothetical protein [Brevundimonas sp.]HYC99167.1 hypothetical protein [Brevundimonas sp.]